MLTSNRFKLAVMAAAVIASTSSAFAIDSARDQQLQQANLNNVQPYTARFDARAEFRPMRGHAGRIAPTISAEPFTAAEKRAFQTPTGREVDRW
jgi:hypothetical protein